MSKPISGDEVKDLKKVSLMRILVSSSPLGAGRRVLLFTYALGTPESAACWGMQWSRTPLKSKSTLKQNRRLPVGKDVDLKDDRRRVHGISWEPDTHGSTWGEAVPYTPSRSGRTPARGKLGYLWTSGG